jgi:glycosyltransferase involved in cell wall biosynthesis
MKAWNVAEYVQKNNVDIIHAHLPWAGLVAKCAGYLTDVPVIYTEHNKQERYHVLTRFLNLSTMNFARVVIPVSHDVQKSIQKNKPRLSANLQVILNCVDTDKYNPQNFNGNAVREQLGIPSNAFAIGTVCVFRPQKRLDLWLKVACQILKAKPNTHFIIIGDGPLKKELLEKPEILSLTGHLHFPGLQTEVRPFLSALNMYMISSIYEGLPIAMLEAMSMELPVVATQAGGINEVVRAGVEGQLVNVDEVMKLSDCAVQLIENESLRIKMSKAARRRIVNEFSMAKMVKELESIYFNLDADRHQSFA